MWLVARRRESNLPIWHTATQVGATAALFALLAWRSRSEVEILVPSSLAVTAVPLALLDARTRRLPNWLILAAYCVLIGVAVPTTVVQHVPGAFLRALAGMLIFLAFYGALYAAFRGQLGGGDVKLGGLLGFTLGWASWSALLFGTLLGWGLAAAMSLFLRAKKPATRDSMMPVAPFLIMGTLVTLVASIGA